MFKFLYIFTNPLFLFFFIIATLMDVKWYLIVVLIFISLMTSVIRASFHVLKFFFWRNNYSSPLSIFKIVLLLLLFLSFRTSPCVLDTNPLYDLKIFSPYILICGLSFHSVDSVLS